MQNKKEALDELEHQVNRGFIATIRFIRQAPTLITDELIWDEYRDNPRFKALDKKAHQLLENYKQELAPLIEQYMTVVENYKS